MKKVITYGTYDLFHQGHYNLLKRAKALGDYLIVGVTTDNFDLERGKLNVCNNVMQRVEAVRATGLADEIIIEEYVGQKIDDIKRYNVDVFAIGSDWIGKFDYLREYCDVLYLPRTEGISSTMLREERPAVRIGVVGSGSIATRFIKESSYVNSLRIVSVYNPFDKEGAIKCCNDYGIDSFECDWESFIGKVDAIYIASPHLTHQNYCQKALEADKHILCETPFSFSDIHARELLEMAQKRNRVLMVALKTAYCPAFCHLITLLKTGVIGDIVDINASVTSLLDESSDKLNHEMAGGSMSENACFPLLVILKLLGCNFKDIHFYSMFRNHSDIFTKCLMLYQKSTASFNVGLGVKSEGNLIISGTKGYAYVPAPWWKTDYFEIRYEDQNRNRKYFYPYEGDGLRYEIKDFISAILNDSSPFTRLSKDEIIAMAKIQNLFRDKYQLSSLVTNEK